MNSGRWKPKTGVTPELEAIVAKYGWRSTEKALLRIGQKLVVKAIFELPEKVDQAPPETP